MNPAPTCIRSEASLTEAATRMVEEDRSCLVVSMTDASMGLGIVTREDVLLVMADVGSDLEGLRVSDVMTHPVVTLPSHYSVGTSIQMMRRLGVKRAPVVDGHALVGFVSFTDLFHHAMNPNRIAV